MAKLNLLEKMAKQCTTKPVVIEIWSSYCDDKAKNLKPFIDNVKGLLQQRYPEIEFLSTSRTNVLRNFDHPFTAGYCYGYVIKISPNLDVYELKRSCMEFEIDNLGNRVADIDIYVSWREKISRKMPDSHR